MDVAGPCDTRRVEGDGGGTGVYVREGGGETAVVADGATARRSRCGGLGQRDRRRGSRHGSGGDCVGVSCVCVYVCVRARGRANGMEWARVNMNVFVQGKRDNKVGKREGRNELES